jgi:hypothetical protein
VLINCVVESNLQETVTMSSIVLYSLGNNNANNDSNNNNEDEETFPIPTIYRYVTLHIFVVLCRGWGGGDVRARSQAGDSGTAPTNSGRNTTCDFA